MIWNKIELLGYRKESKKDALGNRIPEAYIIAETRARLVLTADSRTAAGRTLKAGEAGLVLPIPYKTAYQAKKARYKGKEYDITRITETPPRWTSLTVRGWGV